MNRSGFTTRTPAATAVLAAAAASGLVLAGCGTSSSATTASTSSSASGQPAAAGSASAGPASNGASSNGASSDGSGTVGTALFPVTVGNTWVYQEKLNTAAGTVTNKVISVSPAAGGNKVAMKVQDDLPGLHTGTTTSIFIIHSDGSISVPVTQAGTTSIRVKSGSVVWPSSAQLASGQPNHDTLVISIKEDGHTSNVTAHVVVKGEGTQTVRVPAGTYQTTLINETMTEKFAGITVELDIRTWVANGVGPVKSEVSSNAAGRSVIASVQVLKSFTKG